MRWLWLSLLVLALDQSTKQWAEAALTFGQPLALLPYFDLTLLYNKGAAFSFLGDQDGWQRWFLAGLAIVVTLVLVAWLKRLQEGEWHIGAALGLIIGGAVGNVIDRLLFGHVIDFIDIYYPAETCLPLFGTVIGNTGITCHWPAFNIADSAIFLGVVIIILDVLFSTREG